MYIYKVPQRQMKLAIFSPSMNKIQTLLDAAVFDSFCKPRPVCRGKNKAQAQATPKKVIVIIHFSVTLLGRSILCECVFVSLREAIETLMFGHVNLAEV